MATQMQLQLDQVAKLARDLTGQNVSLLKSDELLEKIIHYFGGNDNFAQIVVNTFNNAPAGAIARQRIIEMVCRLICQNDTPSRPLDEVETQDIANVLKMMMPNGRTADPIDGTAGAERQAVAS